MNPDVLRPHLLHASGPTNEPPRLGAALSRLVNGAAARLARWHRRRVTIRELSALDDRLLEDIGMRRGNIRTVADGLVDGTASGPRFRVEAGGLVAPKSTAAANDNRLQRIA